MATLAYSLVTVYQFIKVKAMVINPAVLTLIFVVLACVFMIMLCLMYVSICTGMDSDYWQNDNLKGPVLGIFLSGAVSAAIEVGALLEGSVLRVAPCRRTRGRMQRRSEVHGHVRVHRHHSRAIPLSAALAMYAAMRRYIGAHHVDRRTE